MARPPRGRLPGSGRSSDDTDNDELPLELPRVDPIRPRVTRPQRTEPKLEAKFDEADTEKGPRRFVPPLRAAIPEPPASPRPMMPEKVDNPFDYYAMPKDEIDPLSRPILKQSASASESSEFLTSKYYTPRSDLIAKREFDESVDQTANWARSVRPGRPILDPKLPDDEPSHMRGLPPRVREHLRSEPKMPSASEALGTFAQSASTPAQLRARSGVPLPLAPELRAPVPQDVRVTRTIPDIPVQPAHNDQSYDDHEEDPHFSDVRHHVLSEPEFDSASDEAVTEFERDIPPLQTDGDMQVAFERNSTLNNDERTDDPSLMPQPVDAPQLPSWMRRTDEPVPPPPVAVSDWDQDEALHALTSRIRSRASETMQRQNRPLAGSIGKALFGAVGHMGTKMRDKARDIQNARSRAKRDQQATAEFNTHSAVELRATRDGDPPSAFEAVPEIAIDYSIAEERAFKKPRQIWSLFKLKPRKPIVQVSVESNRAARRKRQSRLYEDIVAWIVVPPFIIGAIYGGLELAKLISNSPLGKMLAGQ